MPSLVAASGHLGIPLGILTGTIAGIAVIAFVRTLINGVDAKTAVLVVGELTAIPASLLGGPWVTTSMMKSVELEDIVSSYVTTISVIVGLCALIGIGALVLLTADDVRRRRVGA